MRPRIKCKQCGKQFSTQWAEKPEDKALPRGAVVSERFELARNFCNKLWNASRFALMNLDGFDPGRVADDELMVEDSWILSRLATVTQQVTDALAEYRFADAARVLYDFAWDEFCSFYVEMVKGRLQDESAAVGRPSGCWPTRSTRCCGCLHPMIPFLTEDVWQRLGEVAPERGHRRGRAGGREHHAGPLARERSGAAGRRRSRPNSPASRKCCGRCATSAPGRAWRRRRRSRSPSAATPRWPSCLRPMEPYFASMANARPTAFGPDVTRPGLERQRDAVRHGRVRRSGRV